MLLIEPWCIFEEQRHVMVVLLLTIHGNTGNFIADEAVNIMRINKAHTADTDGQLFAGVAIIQRLALLFQLGDHCFSRSRLGFGVFAKRVEELVHDLQVNG